MNVYDSRRVCQRLANDPERLVDLQGDSGGKVSILGGECVCQCGKKIYINMCLNLNSCRDRAV